MVSYTDNQWLELSPKAYRDIVRNGKWSGDSLNKCRGYAVTDLFIIPKEYAPDYMIFCHRNSHYFSIVEITQPGSPHPTLLAPDADLRTDLPRYRVYKNGEVIDEPTDIKQYWRDDLICFLMGCSGSFDWALKAANVQYRGYGGFTTNIPCIPYGPFSCNLAVSCRLFRTAQDAVRAIQITSRHISMHGSPIHIGNPTAIGIRNLSKPDLIQWGSKEPQKPDEIAMFWPNSATNRIIAAEPKLPICIVDYPLSVFMTDKLAEELTAL